jgi:hypothetical protein
MKMSTAAEEGKGSPRERVEGMAKTEKYRRIARPNDASVVRSTVPLRPPMTVSLVDAPISESTRHARHDLLLRGFYSLAVTKPGVFGP